MKKQIKDGWHEISEFTSVYTENGMILRATKNSGQMSASVYKPSVYGGLENACPCRYETFRKAYREGRYVIR